MFEVKRLEKYKTPRIIDLYKIENELDFTPSYQRYGEVWDDDKKRLLIDTIINGYDIPKFYFHFLLGNEDTINTSNKKFAIIDGKQRLFAIFNFLRDNYALDQSVKFLKNPKLNLDNKKYSDLEKNKDLFEIKLLIDNYILDIVHILSDESDRIEEMFLRLNEGVAVNNAEKRNSYGGYLMDEINYEAEHHSFFKSYVKFGNKRMEHQDLLAKLCLLESTGDIQSFTKGKLDKLIKDHRAKKTASSSEKHNLKVKARALVDQVLTNINRLMKIFSVKDELLKSKGILPLYYIFIKEHKDVNKTKPFLSLFETKRASNRNIIDINNANKTLLQFDRLNQQGANQSKSLITRKIILDHYYNEYIKGNKSFKSEVEPSKIGLKKVDAEKEEIV